MNGSAFDKIVSDTVGGKTPAASSPAPSGGGFDAIVANTLKGTTAAQPPISAQGPSQDSFNDIVDQAVKGTIPAPTAQPAPKFATTDRSDFDSLIQKHATANGIDPNLLRALIQQESSFNPKSTSSAGAMGLTQLMPDTAKGLGVTDPYDPDQNIGGGAKYLKQQLDMFKGNVPLALAAYNAGPGRVIKARGIPNIPETQDYVRKIMGNYKAPAVDSETTNAAPGVSDQPSETIAGQTQTRSQLLAKAKAIESELQNPVVGGSPDAMAQHTTNLRTQLSNIYQVLGRSPEGGASVNDLLDQAKQATAAFAHPTPASSPAPDTGPTVLLPRPATGAGFGLPNLRTIEQMGGGGTNPLSDTPAGAARIGRLSPTTGDVVDQSGLANLPFDPAEYYNAVVSRSKVLPTKNGGTMTIQEAAPQMAAALPSAQASDIMSPYSPAFGQVRKAAVQYGATPESWDTAVERAREQNLLPEWGGAQGIYANQGEELAKDENNPLATYFRAYQAAGSPANAAKILAGDSRTESERSRWENGMATAGDFLSYMVGGTLAEKLAGTAAEALLRGGGKIAADDLAERLAGSTINNSPVYLRATGQIPTAEDLYGTMAHGTPGRSALDSVKYFDQLAGESPNPLPAGVAHRTAVQHAFGALADQLAFMGPSIYGNALDISRRDKIDMPNAITQATKNAIGGLLTPENGGVMAGLTALFALGGHVLGHVGSVLANRAEASGAPVPEPLGGERLQPMWGTEGQRLPGPPPVITEPQSATPKVAPQFSGPDAEQHLAEAESTLAPDNRAKLDQLGDALAQTRAWQPTQIAGIKAVVANILRLGQESGKPITAIQAIDSIDPTGKLAQEIAAPFYSKLEQVVSDKVPNNATPDQIRNTLIGAGVKPEEMQWTGTDKFLSDAQGPVAKQDLLDHLSENQVRVNEIVKGEGTKPTTKQFSDAYEWVQNAPHLDADGRTAGFNALDKLRRGPDLGATGQLEDLGAPDGIANPFREYSNPRGEGTKFSQWALPGGSNYREMLLQLPPKAETAHYQVGGYVPKDGFATREAAQAYIDDWQSRIAEMRKDPQFAPVVKKFEETPFFINEYRTPAPDTYTQGHWDEPNVLAHIRFDDRTGPNGEKILHVAEIQSDWHQTGRKNGYHTGKYEVFDPRDGKTITQFDTEAEAKAYVADKPALDYSTPETNAHQGSVPDAPFKKTWHELALKRILRYSAEHGDSPALQKVSEPQSVRELGNQFFGRELASAMPLKASDGGMLSMLKHEQVRRDVIRRIPVDVMDVLRSLKSSPEDVLRNPSVFLEPVAVEVRRRVGLGILDATRQSLAHARAELSRGLETGRDVEVFPALKASDLTAREVVGALAPERIYHMGLTSAASDLDIARPGAVHASPTDVARVNKEGVPASGAEFLHTPLSAGDGAEFGRGATGPHAKGTTTRIANLLDWHNDILSKERHSLPVDYTPGYSKVTWDTGATNADRYNLANHVDAVRISGDPSQGLVIEAAPKGKPFEVMAKDVPVDKLPDYIGKELASKYDPRGENDWRGVDLHIGGEGMKGFYDKILPDAANKIGKRFGAKVEEAHIPTSPTIVAEPSPHSGRGWIVHDPANSARGIIDSDLTEAQAKARAAELNSPKTAHGINITPEMRKSLVNEGQPLFQTKMVKRQGRWGRPAQYEVRGAYDPATRVIQLATGKADVSTALHEIAHYFHDVLLDHPEWGATIRKAYGDLTNTKGAEQFARHFESYFYDGRSPVKAMQPIFEAIKGWMRDIYSKFAKNNQVPAHIRDIFDKVVGADHPETQALIKEFHDAVADERGRVTGENFDPVEHVNPSDPRLNPEDAEHYDPLFDAAVQHALGSQDLEEGAGRHMVAEKQWHAEHGHGLIHDDENTQTLIRSLKSDGMPIQTDNTTFRRRLDGTMMRRWPNNPKMVYLGDYPPDVARTIYEYAKANADDERYYASGQAHADRVKTGVKPPYLTESEFISKENGGSRNVDAGDNVYAKTLVPHRFVKQLYESLLSQANEEPPSVARTLGLTQDEIESVKAAYRAAYDANNVPWYDAHADRDSEAASSAGPNADVSATANGNGAGADFALSAPESKPTQAALVDVPKNELPAEELQWQKQKIEGPAQPNMEAEMAGQGTLDEGPVQIPTRIKVLTDAEYQAIQDAKKGFGTKQQGTKNIGPQDWINLVNEAIYHITKGVKALPDLVAKLFESNPDANADDLKKAAQEALDTVANPKFGKEPEGPRYGAYNDRMADTLRGMGLDAPDAAAKQKVADWVDTAHSKGYVEGATRLADSVLNDGARLDNEQTVGIAMRVADLARQYDEVNAKIRDGGLTPELERQKKLIESESAILGKAAKVGGSSWGREGVARQAEFNQRMDLLGLKERFADTVERPMTADEERGFTMLSEEYKKVTAELDAAKKQIADMVARRGQRTARTGDLDAIRSERKEIIGRLYKLTGRASAGLDPEIAAELGKLVVNYLKEGGIHLTDAVDRVRAQFPEFSARDIRDAFSGYGKESKPMTPENKAVMQERRVGRLQSQIEDLEAGNVLPKRERAEVPAEIEKLIARKNFLRKKAEIEIQRKQPKNPAQVVAGWVREGYLSNLPVFAKLLSYDAMEQPVAAARDLIGPMFNKLNVGDGKTLGDVDITQARISPKATFSRIAPSTIAEAAKNAYDVLVNHVDKFSEVSGKIPRELSGPIGGLHGVTKQFIGTQEFRSSFNRGVEFMEKRRPGSTRDPDVVNVIAQQAAIDALNVKLQGYNEFADLLNRLPRTARGAGITHNAIGLIAEALLPFRRVPSNLLKQSVDYTGAGLLRGEIARRRAIAGKAELTPEMAKEIRNAYTRGGIGAVVALVGWMQPNWLQSSGYTDPDWKKKDRTTVFGWELPHVLSHHPVLEALNFWATLRHAYDAQQSAEGVAQGLGNVGGAVLGESPGAIGLQNIGSAIGGRPASDRSKSNYSEKGVAFGHIVSPLVVPRLFSSVAKALDSDDFWATLMTGEGARPVSPKSFGDVLKADVPFLRQDLTASRQKHQ